MAAFTLEDFWVSRNQAISVGIELASMEKKLLEFALLLDRCE